VPAIQLLSKVERHKIIAPMQAGHKPQNEVVMHRADPSARRFEQSLHLLSLQKSGFFIVS
jgi:hypothetical protein